MRADAITLRQLRALAAVAEQGSLTAAGQALSLTTPAIHTQIKGLENAFACSLVRPKPDHTGSRLTPQGLAVLEAFGRMEDVLSQCASEVAAIGRGLSGHFTLGVVSTGMYFAPRLVRQLREDCPEIEISLRIGNRESVISGLQRGSIELAIMGRPPRHPEVLAEPIGPHPHGLLADPANPLTGLAEVSAKDLMGATILSREDGSGTRILMTRYLDRIGDGHVFDFIEMDSNETIKQAAMAGLGIAFLSLHTVTDELASGRLLPIRAPGLPILRQWFLVQPAGQVERAVVRRVRLQILGLGGSFLPAGVAA